MSTELLITLPEELQAFYEESGYLPTTAIENRTNARLRVRRDGKIKFVYTPEALMQQPGFRDGKKGRALIKDLSKTGIGILYHEQIFPEERFQILFQGRRIHVTAVRCRRLNSRCFEIGGQVDALESMIQIEPHFYS